MLVSLNRRIATGGMRGLRGFDPSGSYAMTANILDMQQDSLVADRVQQIVSGGSVGTFNNSQVYEEPASGSLFVNVGLAYPVLQEIRPQVLMDPPPVGGSPLQPCPCDNCREESVTETYYASKEQQSASDIPVSMVRDVVICEPSTADGTPTPKCAEDLAKLKAQLGLQGVRGLRGTAYSIGDRKKRCIDGCKGLPEDKWNICMSRCNTVNPVQLSAGSFQQGYIFTGVTSGTPIMPTTSRTAGSAWGNCVTACNGQHLSQEQLQRCYAACPTSGIVAPSNSGIYTTPNAQSFALSGLSNDSSVVDDPSLYTADAQSQLYLPAPVPCQSGNNTLWFLIIGGACTLLGYIIAVALKKR